MTEEQILHLHQTGKVRMSSEHTHKSWIALAADAFFPNHNPSSDTTHVLTSLFICYAPNQVNLTTLNRQTESDSPLIHLYLHP